jgi:DNA-binding CsgD family transcriptional regulator
VVVVFDDSTQVSAELASFVGYLQRFVWQNGPQNIEVVAAGHSPDAESPFVERRRRTTDRRQTPGRPRADADAAASAGSERSKALPRSPLVDARHPCTCREREIVELLRRGLTNKQIAQQLGIMEETVKKHLQHIFDKYGVRRRALVMLDQVGGATYVDRHPALP